MVFLFVCFLIINCHYKVIYRGMNRFKPVIAFISLNRLSHLEIERQTYKGPLRSLHRVRTEIPALSLTFFKQYHHSQWKTRGTKKKSLSMQINFLTVEKRQKSDGNLVEEVQ